MSVLVVIPARYGSTRYPGKPLVHLRGSDGAKPLIQRSWEAARQIDGIDRLVIATDDDRIAETARGFGAEVVMTPESCANGTERCAVAYDLLGEKFEIVVNFQGDALLTPPWFVAELVAGLRTRPDVQMATPVLRCDGAALRNLLNDRKAGRVGGTTAVFGAHQRALYFSKEVIPYNAGENAELADPPVYHHVGVYAFRADTLLEYPHWPAGPLELQEGLEQLRFLEQGRDILCVEVEAKGRVFWELNNPEDVPRIESVLT